MVRADSGIETLEDLEGGSVCVATGTTTEKNLADVMGRLDIEYEAVTFEDTGDVNSFRPLPKVAVMAIPMIPLASLAAWFSSTMLLLSRSCLLLCPKSP